ncbi:MAG: YXWGXW repeat-containing protein, partial [Sinobacteraceae bacterium]|nr:YXWGXW repeat-containing protein [Nevskiaceae bacterium]
GYWAWDDGDYYWVPGTWVAPPEVGYLWTPGYWGWNEGVYLWHAGYWGLHVGFYGGVHYGYGYEGEGYEGGYWRGGAFYYNRSVSNLSEVHVTNVYNKTVVNNVTVVNRVSYNGGNGGISARPRPGELAAEREHHIEFTPVQREHEHMAAGNRDLRASVNEGRPRIAATARPTAFTGHGVIAARAAGGPVHSEARNVNTRGGESRPDARGSASHSTMGQPHEQHAPTMSRSDRPPGAVGNGPVEHGSQSHNAPTAMARAPAAMSNQGANAGTGMTNRARPVPNHESAAPHHDSIPQQAGAARPPYHEQPRPEFRGGAEQRSIPQRPPVQERAAIPQHAPAPERAAPARPEPRAPGGPHGDPRREEGRR